MLADQNVGPDVVEGLRARGLDVYTVAELGLDTASDSDILAHAHAESRLVVTHDRNFGKLEIARGEPLGVSCTSGQVTSTLGDEPGRPSFTPRTPP